MERNISPGKISSIMPNWYHSDSYSRIHSDFKNAQKDCVHAFSRFSELLVDYNNLHVATLQIDHCSKTPEEYSIQK